MKKLVAVLLTTSVLLSMAAGCKKKTSERPSRKPTQTTEEPEISQVELGEVPTVKRENGQQAVFELSASSENGSMTDEELDQAYCQFVFGLMARCAGNAGKDNVLISPDSVLFALSMAAAGANGETLNQMMNVMVPGADNGAAFQYAVNRMNSLENESMRIANSVWINQEWSDGVYDDYLQYVQRHFDAGMSVLPFDNAAVELINSWVESKTEGRIKDLISELEPSNIMVLVNAIAFDAEWATAYEEDQVRNGTFTNGSGEEKEVTFLYGSENIYLENGEAIGFLKPYEDGKYAFLTILPEDRDVDINEFMADMTAEEYREFWESRDTYDNVYTSMPEFKNEYEVMLPDILQDMGMEYAFDRDAADFSNMCIMQAYISKVIHKTYIEVDRNGTKAAAATAVVMDGKSAMPVEEKEVFCDRPFAYAIVDLQTGVPVFIGTVEDV